MSIRDLVADRNSYKGILWLRVGVKIWSSFAVETLPKRAYNLIRWATFRLQKVKKKSERWEKKTRKGKDEKEEKNIETPKTPHLVCFFVLYYKTGDKLKLDLVLAHLLRLWPYFFTKTFIQWMPPLLLRRKAFLFFQARKRITNSNF